MLFIDKPHNPLLNSGAIMSSALLLKLVHSHMEMSEKFDLVWKYFSKIAGKVFSLSKACILGTSDFDKIS
jgi:hypothetical protein